MAATCVQIDHLVLGGIGDTVTSSSLRFMRLLLDVDPI
jgi:hypothetical protein